MAVAAPYIPYIVAAVASAGSAYNASKTAEEQDRNAAAGIRMQSQKQQQATAQVNDLLDKQSRSNPEAAGAASRDSFLKQIAAHRSAANDSFQPVGAASSRYTQDTANAQDQSNTYATDLAGIMSRLDAPARQRQAEAEALGRASTNIGLVGNAAAGDSFLTRLKASRIAPNPWIDAISKAGNAYASAKAGQGTSAKPAKPMLGNYDAANPAWYG